MEKDSVLLDMPTMEAFESYIEALHEGYRAGIQSQKTKLQIESIQADPAAYLKSLNDQSGTVELPNGDVVPKVPYESLWLMSGKTFIGEVSFRHELNENLRLHGGHIGYGIRPSFKSMGYGTLAMKLVKERAKKMGIEKLLLTCSPDNPASEKIILNNGGVYVDTQTAHFGFGPTKRFWIYL